MTSLVSRIAAEVLASSAWKQLERLLERCTVCPRDCLNNRLNNDIAACYSGRSADRFVLHGTLRRRTTARRHKGAGNIFFGNCNLRCVYCQNYQISQTHKQQLKNEVTHERLAEMLLELQERGCHNINFVSPTHFAPQMARSIFLAAQNGLRLPMVYNTNAYDAVQFCDCSTALSMFILPDLKYADDESGYLYSKVSGYKEFSRLALREMYRQTGDELVFDENGLLKRDLVVRLLVLPNDIGSVSESIEWIRDELESAGSDFVDGPVLPDAPGGDEQALCFAVATYQGKRMDEGDGGA